MGSVLDIGQMLQMKQVASPMKKLFLTEFDTSDKKTDYDDNTDTWSYILKIMFHSIRDLRQRFLIENTS